MTALRSLGLATDILALTGLAEVVEHPDRIVVRTPSEPDFWFGNFIVLRDARTDQAVLDQFAADFPDAGHVTLIWDIPGPAEGAGLAALRDAGFDMERDEVLVAYGAVAAPPAPAGYDLREIASEDDWAQVRKLHAWIDRQNGYDGPVHEDYIRRRFANTRAQNAAGLGARFGAFDQAGRLAADLGILHDDRVGRYQTVATDPAHRRRGLCAALVGHAAHWAHARVPGLPLVIVAEPAGDAGRIYRRCGFVATESVVSACRSGY